MFTAFWSGIEDAAVAFVARLITAGYVDFRLSITAAPPQLPL